MAWTPPDKEEPEGFAPPDAAEPVIGAGIPGFAAASKASGIGAAPPDKGDDLWTQTARAIRGALGGDEMFGSPDREEAKKAGIGLYPTPADMISSLGTAASVFGGAGAVAEGFALPGQIAGAARGAPGVMGALSKALPAAVRNSPNIAAAVGAGGGGYAGKKIGGLVGMPAQGAAVGSALGLLAAGRLARPSVMAEVVGEPTPGTPPIIDAEYVTNPVGKAAGSLSTVDSAARALPAAVSPRALPPARQIQLGPASVPKAVEKVVDRAVEKSVDAARQGRKLVLPKNPNAVVATAADKAAAAEAAKNPTPASPVGYKELPFGSYGSRNYGQRAAEFAGSKVKNVVEPITDPEVLIGRIRELKDVQKLSGAQIAAALKQWHGIPMKEATQAVKMVLGAQ